MVSDKKNLVYCTIIQTGSKEEKDVSNSEHTKSNNNQDIKYLGMKKAQSRTVINKDGLTEGYCVPFINTMECLMKNNNDVEGAKLSLEQCASVLTLGFHLFVRFGLKKTRELCAAVRRDITKDYVRKAIRHFWVNQR